MLGVVTLRDLAARIQELQPEALDWWNSLTTDERKDQLAKVIAAEKDAKAEAVLSSGTKKKRPARRSRGGEPDAPLEVPKPRQPSLALLTGRLETSGLLKKQIGSGGRWQESEGFRYLRENSPFAVEQRAHPPQKNGPAKKTKPAPRRAAPGVREAARNTNKKLAAAGFEPLYDFGS